MGKQCFFCLCLSFFLLDSDVGGDHPSMALSLHSCRFRPSHPRTLRLFSAFSPAGPKGCSKDDERVLKGCLSLCHPSQKLFFCRKHLYGTILFPKFSANVLLFFDICKFWSVEMIIFWKVRKDWTNGRSRKNRSFGRFFCFYLHICKKNRTFAADLIWHIIDL